MYTLLTTVLFLSGTPDCSYDRSRMLGLGAYEFDQGADGWRRLSMAGCELEAANLIRDYRTKQIRQLGVLFWHEGQLRAFFGEIENAINLFNVSRRDDDHYGWNIYVDATIAFLRRDKAALLVARDRLASLPKPPDFSPVDAEGAPLSISWPPNLNVVDGLIECFDKNYREAYQCGEPFRVER